MNAPPTRTFHLALATLALALGQPDTTAAQSTAKPLGGLSQLYAWPEERRNLIANPSFESVGPDATPLLWSYGDTSWSLNSSVRRTGSRSLRLKDSNLARFTPLATQPLQLTPGWYNLRGYAKSVNAGTLTRGSGGRVVLARGNGRESTQVLSGTANWTRLSRNSFLVEEGSATAVRLEAYRKPNGSIFFDDVALHRLTPPFIEGFLLYPNYRGTLFQDRSQIIQVSVTTRPNVRNRKAGDFLVSLVLETSTGARVASVERSLPGHTATTLTLNASRAPLDTLRLRIRAIDAQTRTPFYEYPPYIIAKVPAARRQSLKTYVAADNALVINGRRRFVLGIYDTSGHSAQPSYYEPRISKIAEAPFNMYLNYWLGGIGKPQMSALTTTLRKYGMSYLHTSNAWYEGHQYWSSSNCNGTPAPTLGQIAFTVCKARELADIPGLAGWYTADERTAADSARVFNQYLLLRGNDVDGVTFIAQNRPRELVRWRDVADVVGVDPYPIYNVPLGQLSPLNMVLNWVDTAQESVQRSRPVWAVIQFFQHGSKGHWPTESELRSMSYMAIIAGAKGLFYWSNGAAALGWVQDPELKERYWQRLVKVTREIRGLENVLLAPHSRVLSSVSDARIRVMTKQVAGVRYVFAVNNSKDNLNVRFRLAQPGQTAVVHTERRTRSVVGGFFNDGFGPYAVHVYRIPPVS